LNIDTIITSDLVVNLESTTKDDVLNEMIDIIGEKISVLDIQSLREKIFHREELMSTGIGLHIGIPHVRMGGIDKPIIAIGVQPRGVSKYESIDSLPVKLVVMIICGANQHKIHIKILSQIVSLLKKDENLTKILTANNTSKIYHLFVEG